MLLDEISPRSRLGARSEADRRFFLPGESVDVTVVPGLRGIGFLELQTGYTWKFNIIEWTLHKRYRW